MATQRESYRFMKMLTLTAVFACLATQAFAQPLGRNPLAARPQESPPPNSQQQGEAAQVGVDQVIAALVEATKSEHENVRIGAYLGLSSFLDDKPELVTIFVEAARSSEGLLQSIVLRELAGMKTTPPAEAIDILVQFGLALSRSSRDGSVIRRFLRRHHELSVPALIGQLQSHADEDYRVAVAEELQTYSQNATAAIQPMLGILADEDEPASLRATVATAVARISKAAADAGVAAVEQPNQARQQAMAMIAQMDLDKDGKLSITEFPVRNGDSEFFFRRMDTDGDGAVTLEELIKVMGKTGPAR